MEPDTTKTSTPLRTIKRKVGVSSLELKQIWEYRDLLATLSTRDIRLRYRQTALGVVWVVLQPLIAAAIFTFVFSRLAGFSTHGVPPMLFTYAGMLAWGAFNGFLGKSSGIIVGSMNLVTKVYFPRLILPLTPIMSTFLDFGVGFVVLLILMAKLGFVPPLSIVALPLVLLLIVMLSLALSLFASAMQVKYRDVQYVIPVLANMLFFISPVGYALSEVGKKIPVSAQGLYALNPLVGLLELARWSMLGTPFPGFPLVAYSTLLTLVMLTLGMFYFKSQERGFADVI